jgi:hypothetical protein
MAENKTKATEASVQDYLAAIEPEAKRRDCEAIAALMARITKCAPKMWGPSIVGFDSVHYKYDSGREGDMSATGFASRKNEIVVYLAADGADQAALLARLGRHKMGKCCLYIRRLDDLDQDVLAQLITGPVAEVRRRYSG